MRFSDTSTSFLALDDYRPFTTGSLVSWTSQSEYHNRPPSPLVTKWTLGWNFLLSKSRFVPASLIPALLRIAHRICLLITCIFVGQGVLGIDFSFVFSSTSPKPHEWKPPPWSTPSGAGPFFHVKHSTTVHCYPANEPDFRQVSRNFTLGLPCRQKRGYSFIAQPTQISCARSVTSDATD